MPVSAFSGRRNVTPHIRRRADSGNVKRHTPRAMRAMGVACKQPASPTTVKTVVGEDGVEGAAFVQQLGTEKQTGNVPICSEWMCKDHSIKTIQITWDNCKKQSH